MVDDAEGWMRKRFAGELGLDARGADPGRVDLVGKPRLASSYPVSALATASVAAAASAAVELIAEVAGARPTVRVHDC